MKKIGQIKGQNLDALKQHCQNILLPMMEDSHSSYTTSRKECWLEKGFRLDTGIVYEAPHDERIYQLGQKLFPDNHCCLALFYERGGYIKPHRDHTVTEAKVVQVNIGCPVIINHDGIDYQVEDGEVISFDTKKLHSVPFIENPRFVVSWRQIKSQHLNPQLNIFS